MGDAADIGIVDETENPFSIPSWIYQHYPFTKKRQQQFVKFINKEQSVIDKQKPVNENKYDAFVAIRWGFAKVLDKRLVRTEKWENRGNYNGYGVVK